MYRSMYCLYILFIFLFDLYLLLYFTGIYTVDYLNNIALPEKLSYDYIVVGTGTAGSILAKRLAESSKYNVLILEAGNDETFFTKIPVLGPTLQKSKYDWQFKTVPQKNACFAMIDNSSSWPIGKIIGGSGRLNNMIHTRGHKLDYDVWYKNHKDYNYERDILTYFDKVEKTITESSSQQMDPIGEMPFYSPVADAILEAANFLGYPVRDLNKYFTGFMKSQVYMRNGKRWSTSDFLLNNITSNLKILTNANVEKVLFSEDLTAYAVQFTHFGRVFEATAKKEIILSAGAIGTPKILMLSGIGPQEHLKSIGIETKVDIPVGDNLQDHVSTGLDLVELNTTLPFSIPNMLNPMNAWNYLYNGSGPWTSSGCEVVGILHTENNTDVPPDLEFMILPVGVSGDKGFKLRTLIGITDIAWDNYFQLLTNKTIITMLTIVLHPESRGVVRLKDSDPNSMPLIDPNYLSIENDIEILVKGIKIIKTLINTDAMQKLGAKLVDISFPGCEDYIFDTDEYWKCYVRHVTLTTYHPIGTCKMGSDQQSVVDYEFKVLHTNHLRVVDASVMPTMPSANINAAVMMIAEKAVDFIFKDNEDMNKSCYLDDLHGTTVCND